MSLPDEPPPLDPLDPSLSIVFVSLSFVLTLITVCSIVYFAPSAWGAFCC